MDGMATAETQWPQPHTTVPAHSITGFLSDQVDPALVSRRRRMEIRRLKVNASSNHTAGGTRESVVKRQRNAIAPTPTAEEDKIGKTFSNGGGKSVKSSTGFWRRDTKGAKVDSKDREEVAGDCLVGGETAGVANVEVASTATGRTPGSRFQFCEGNGACRCVVCCDEREQGLHESAVPGGLKSQGQGMVPQMGLASQPGPCTRGGVASGEEREEAGSDPSASSDSRRSTSTSCSSEGREDSSPSSVFSTPSISPPDDSPDMDMLVTITSSSPVRWPVVQSGLSSRPLADCPPSPPLAEDMAGLALSPHRGRIPAANAATSSSNGIFAAPGQAEGFIIPDVSGPSVLDAASTLAPPRDVLRVDTAVDVLPTVSVVGEGAEDVKVGGGESSMAASAPPHGSYAVCGRRRDMEDAVACAPGFTTIPCSGPGGCVHAEGACGSKDGRCRLHFFGVFDGHGGSQAALFCAEALPIALATEMESAEAAPVGEQSFCLPAAVEESAEEHPLSSLTTESGAGSPSPEASSTFMPRESAPGEEAVPGSPSNRSLASPGALRRDGSSETADGSQGASGRVAGALSGCEAERIATGTACEAAGDMGAGGSAASGGRGELGAGGGVACGREEGAGAEVEGGEQGLAGMEMFWQSTMSSTFLDIDRRITGVCNQGPECRRAGCGAPVNETRGTGGNGGVIASARCDPGNPLAPENVGSTAVVAIVGTTHIAVANVGDSRAVLSRGGKAIPLSRDHKPDLEDEMARIEGAGGRVIYWNGYRVLGVLAMSRAIGDRYLKPYVIAEPEVTVTPRSKDDECLILASDGLWDVISNELACDIVRRCMRSARRRSGGASRKNGPPAGAQTAEVGATENREKERGGVEAHVAVAAKPSSNAGGGPEVQVKAKPTTPEEAMAMAAMVLTKLALSRGSTDNVSVVVVDVSMK